MKFTIPFVVIRKAVHANPDRPLSQTVSLRLIPVRDPDPQSATRQLWEGDINGEIGLNYLEPRMVEDIEPGCKVMVTFDCPPPPRR